MGLRVFSGLRLVQLSKGQSGRPVYRRSLSAVKSIGEPPSGLQLVNLRYTFGEWAAAFVHCRFARFRIESRSLLHDLGNGRNITSDISLLFGLPNDLLVAVRLLQ